MTYMILRTLGGYWDPLLWVLAIVVISLIVYIIRAAGKKEFKRGDQEKPYYSGLKEPSKEEMHVRASNIYWGFTEALKGYYVSLKKMHSGLLNDYIIWFIAIAALLFIALFVGGVIYFFLEML